MIDVIQLKISKFDERFNFFGMRLSFHTIDNCIRSPCAPGNQTLVICANHLHPGTEFSPTLIRIKLPLYNDHFYQGLKGDSCSKSSLQRAKL